jgi:hypothetical protein
MPSANPKTHHLFRVRIRTSTWSDLCEIAKSESARVGEYVSASDLARYALNDWVTAYRAAERLGALRPPEVATKVQEESRLTR